MKRKGVIFIIAAMGIFSAVWAIKRGAPSPIQAPLIVEPAQKPYHKSLAASGIIEAVGENISIGSPENGLVRKVYVKVHDPVKKGDPLFRLDCRELEAELKVAEAKEDVARAQYNRMQDHFTRLQSVKDMRAISPDELRSKENENAIGAATVMQMEREKEKLLLLIDRMTVRSPIDGMILQKTVQKGEYIVAANVESPPMVIGNTTHLQIRTDIDEHNASNLETEARAIAYLKNRPNFPIELTFQRIEPLVVPKVSLTGSSKEKVDTRVLQVIYTFEPPKDLTLYVGQQVDVFIQRGQDK